MGVEFNTSVIGLETEPEYYDWRIFHTNKFGKSENDKHLPYYGCDRNNSSVNVGYVNGHEFYTAWSFGNSLSLLSRKESYQPNDTLLNNYKLLDKRTSRLIYLPHE